MPLREQCLVLAKQPTTPTSSITVTTPLSLPQGPAVGSGWAMLTVGDSVQHLQGCGETAGPAQQGRGGRGLCSGRPEALSLSLSLFSLSRRTGLIASPLPPAALSAVGEAEASQGDGKRAQAHKERERSRTIHSAGVTQNQGTGPIAQQP